MIKFLKKIKQRLYKFYYLKLPYLSKNIKRKSFYKFIDEGGRELYFRHIHLNDTSTVFDVGGYVGDFASEIFDRFNCNVIIFEPVPEYVEILRKKFKDNPKIIIHDYGLSDKTENIVIHIAGPSSSFFNKVETANSTDEVISVVSILDFLEKNPYNKIDLMKINIEGAEYPLLESLLGKQKEILRIQNLQIQFHDFIPDAEKRREQIRIKLSSTHNLKWDFPFIWESWQLKTNNKEFSI